MNGHLAHFTYVRGYYLRQVFKKGQQVILLGKKGIVKQINNIGIVIETNDGGVNLPNNRIIEKGSFKINLKKGV